jgi:Spy/CpxP family protein refolding chaperone
MLNKTLALLLIFSLAFNIAFVGIWTYVKVLPEAPPPPAPVPGPEAGPDGGRDGRRMPWSHLGLRPGQDAEMRQVWSQYQGQLRALGEEAGQHRARLFELLEAEELDAEAIHAEQDAIDKAQQEMSRLTLEQMRRVHQVLTPEQRRRWLQTMKAHGERLRGRYGERGAGPRGARPGGPRAGGLRPGQRARWGRPANGPAPGAPSDDQMPERRQNDEAQ